MYSVSMQKYQDRHRGSNVGLGRERRKCPQAGRKWNKRAKMENRKKSDGRKGKGDMAAVGDLYHRRLLGTIQSTISARNAE